MPRFPIHALALIAVLSAGLLFSPTLEAAANPQLWVLELDPLDPMPPDQAAERRELFLVEAEAVLGRELTPLAQFGADGSGMTFHASSTEAYLLRNLAGVRSVNQELVRTVTSASGYIDLEFAAPGPGNTATVSHTGLGRSDVYTLNVAGEGGEPYAGTPGSLVVFGVSGTHVSIDGSADGSNVDLYAGWDANGDGKPQLEEEMCRATSPGSYESCANVGGGPASWIIVHNRQGPGTNITMRKLMIDSVGRPDYEQIFYASAQGLIPAGENFSVRAIYNDASLADGEHQLAYLTLSGATGDVQLPLRLVREGRAVEATTMQVARELHVMLPPGGRHDRLVIEVPVAADYFYVQTVDVGRQNTRFYAWHDPNPGSGPDIPPVPADATLLEAFKVGVGLYAFNFPKDEIKPGRWYLIPVNLGSKPALVKMFASTDVLYRNRVQVQPGSYYNPDRPGHGVFMYPSAKQRVLIWYTYDESGLPTWYYAQYLDLEIATNEYRGIESADLYRVAWQGGERQMYKVGRVVITATAKDAFTMSYVVDGKHGSEKMEAFLTGCPTVGGAPLDVSTHWFDPLHAGTGYSVQVHPGYEFFATYVFDQRGLPRFLTAERGGAFDGAPATLDLVQVEGFPLTGPHQAPVRTPVGTLTRTYAGGSLATVDIDAEFTNGVSGSWRQSDQVVPLSGTQGCTP